MKTLIYQVYTGKRSKLYDHCTDSVARYAKRIGAEYILQRTPSLFIKPDPFNTNRSKESYEKYGGFLPIYEKENAFLHLRSFDRIAVIDADVYVRDNAPSIFNEIDDNHHFGAVVERSMPITSKYKQKLANYSRMQYGSIRNVDWKWDDAGAEFMNMGVMVMNKSIEKYLNGETPKQFLSRPRFKPFVDGLGAWKWSTDQTLLNTWIREEKMNIKNIDWRFNGLYTANTKIKECYFVHFFLKDLLPDRGENVEKLMRDIQ